MTIILDTARPPGPPAPTGTPGSAELRLRIRRQARTATLRVVGRGALTFTLTIAAVLIIWQGLLIVSGISPYVAKGPLDVWMYLTTAADAPANRAQIAGDLAITLRDMLVGFSAGLLAALVGAVLFQLWRGLEHALMPVALLLASVPLTAMAPVIILVTGRSSVAVAVIGGIVVLFPSLVAIGFGLRSVSPQIADVITVYGGSAFTAIWKAGIPSAVPSLFSAVRISVPGAITGALLAEWLATGQGIGSTVQRAIPQAQFTALWANVAAITVISLVLYNLVRIVEGLVLARMGSARSD